jgi:arylsulfatase A-like enzyme
MDLFPTFARLTGATIPTEMALDGEDWGDMLAGRAPVESSRLLYHYFGVQLQAVRQGSWKLFVPVAEYPAVRVPSLWFEHQPSLFERQHRLWPAPTLYDLATDIGETRNVAAEQRELVEGLVEAALRLDAGVQRDSRPVLQLPGPKPPRPGTVRTGTEVLDEWRKLSQ